MTVPPLMQRYVERVLPDVSHAPRRIRLTQSGDLRLKPNGRWAPFTATQESALQRVAFSWRALIRMVPLFPIQVVDRYEAGEGTGEIRLMRLPVMRSSGTEVSEGSAQRYLAELPWAPHAVLANSELACSEVDPATVEVAAVIASVTWELPEGPFTWFRCRITSAVVDGSAEA